jgi:hypothetical protein
MAGAMAEKLCALCILSWYTQIAKEHNKTARTLGMAMPFANMLAVVCILSF